MMSLHWPWCAYIAKVFLYSLSAMQMAAVELNQLATIQDADDPKLDILKLPLRPKVKCEIHLHYGTFACYVILLHTE